MDLRLDTQAKEAPVEGPLQKYLDRFGRGW